MRRYCRHYARMLRAVSVGPPPGIETLWWLPRLVWRGVMPSVLLERSQKRDQIVDRRGGKTLGCQVVNTGSS